MLTLLPRVGLCVVRGAETAQPRPPAPVTITPLHMVDDDVAHAQGEGSTDAVEWRREHVPSGVMWQSWYGLTQEIPWYDDDDA